MQDIGNTLSAALSENYINYFDYMGRSYEVIPQVNWSIKFKCESIIKLLHQYLEWTIDTFIDFCHSDKKA